MKKKIQMNSVAEGAEMSCQHELNSFITFPDGLQKHTYRICHYKLPRKEGRNKGISSRASSLFAPWTGRPITADTLIQRAESESLMDVCSFKNVAILHPVFLSKLSGVQRERQADVALAAASQVNHQVLTLLAFI